MNVHNLNDHAFTGEEEHFETLLETPRVKLERIVSLGQASPEGFWYDQEEDEWVLLFAGTAELAIAYQAPLSLKAGDHLFIPAHTKHRVAKVSQDAIWLGLFLH